MLVGCVRGRARRGRRSVAAAVAIVLTGGSLVGLAAPASAGASWSIVANPAQSLDTELAGVACTSATSCIVVGSNAGTVTGRWNGKKWFLVPSQSPGGTLGFLFGVACTSATNCFAVGQSTTDSELDSTLVERWDGKRWAIVPSPHAVGSSSSGLGSVSCPSATTCFAVGDSDLGPLVERWDGKRWSVVPSPNPAGVPELSQIACASATSCVAVGFLYGGVTSPSSTFAERWNGTQWSIVPTPSAALVPDIDDGSRLQGVACPSATNCVAVGASDHGALVERWNGTRWTIDPHANNSDLFLNAVSCPTTTKCVAVGDSIADGDDETAVYRLDGTKWSVVPSASPDDVEESELDDVSCTTATKCVAVGFAEFFNPDEEPVVEHS